jgi:hypothetical protein
MCNTSMKYQWTQDGDIFLIWSDSEIANMHIECMGLSDIYLMTY